MSTIGESSGRYLLVKKVSLMSSGIKHSWRLDIRLGLWKHVVATDEGSVPSRNWTCLLKATNRISGLGEGRGRTTLWVHLIVLTVW